MNRVLKTLLRSPHIIYVALAVMFTAVFIVVIPPMSTPDAPQHFIRAYAISEGRWVPDETGPAVFDNSVHGKVGHGDDVGFRPVSRGYYLPTSMVTYLLGEHYATSGLATSKAHPDHAFVYENQTEANSPIAYVTQVLALLLVKPFAPTAAVLAYAQEVALACVWILCLFFAIRIAPFGKWPLLFIALLPMQIQDSFQLGADVMAVAPAVLLAALVARRISDPLAASHASWAELAVVSALAAAAMQGKIVMAPMLLLILLYPLGFSYVGYSRGAFFHRLWQRVAIAIPPLALGWLWLYVARATNRGITDVFLTAPAQVAALNENPVGFIGGWLLQCVRWLLRQFDDVSVIGNFRKLDAPLPPFVAFLACIAVVLLLIAHTPHDVAPGSTGLPPLDRHARVWVNAVYGIVALGVLAATLLSVYIIWNQPGGHGIHGMQGRYLLPCLYIVALMLPPKLLTVSDATMRRVCVAMPVLLFGASLAVLV